MYKKTIPLFSDEQRLKYKERWLIPLQTLRTSLISLKDQHSDDFMYKPAPVALECFLSKISFRSTDLRHLSEQLKEFDFILSQAALAAGFSLHDEHFHITFYEFYECEDSNLVEIIAIVERAIWELEN